MKRYVKEFANDVIMKLNSSLLSDTPLNEYERANLEDRKDRVETVVWYCERNSITSFEAVQEIVAIVCD